MRTMVPIQDVAIWFKHVQDGELRSRLAALSEDETIHLETDGVVGRWRRMRQGKNAAPTPAIRPDGSMKDIWMSWFVERKGELIEVHEVKFADDYLTESSAFFPEWHSPEDDAAFRDL